MEVLWLLLNAQQGLQVCPHTFILPWEVLMVEVPSKSIERQILSLLMVSQHYPLLVATTFWVIPKTHFMSASGLTSRAWERCCGTRCFLILVHYSTSCTIQKVQKELSRLPSSTQRQRAGIWTRI